MDLFWNQVDKTSILEYGSGTQQSLKFDAIYWSGDGSLLESSGSNGKPPTIIVIIHIFLHRIKNLRCTFIEQSSEHTT